MARPAGLKPKSQPTGRVKDEDAEAPSSAPGLLYDLTDPGKWAGYQPHTAPADPKLLHELHGGARTYSDEPFVIRWTSFMAETEEGAVFCVGCGRRMAFVYRDGRPVERVMLPEDGREVARAAAAQRAKIERTPISRFAAQVAP